MSREKELFRDNLARLDDIFPGQEMLSVGDIKAYTGMKDVKTVKKYFDLSKGENYISKCRFASLLS